MPHFELTTHRPGRTRLLAARPASEIRVAGEDGEVVLTCPTILKTTRRSEYALGGDLAGEAALVRSSWSRFRLVDEQAGELARFVMRAPRLGRKMRPSWEVLPAHGTRIVLTSDVPFSTIEGLKRDFRNEILATYRSDEGFQLDVFPGRAELTVEPGFSASLQVAVVAAVIARALHSNPAP